MSDVEALRPVSRPRITKPTPKARVSLHGLESRAELNGKHGRLVRFNKARVRHGLFDTEGSFRENRMGRQR